MLLISSSKAVAQISSCWIYRTCLNVKYVGNTYCTCRLHMGCTCKLYMGIHVGYMQGNEHQQIYVAGLKTSPIW